MPTRHGADTCISHAYAENATIDPNTFTASPLTADAAGNIYYNVVKLQDGNQVYGKDAVDSWLVKVAPDNSVRIVSYTDLLAGHAPGPTDLCYNAFASLLCEWIAV